MHAASSPANMTRWCSSPASAKGGGDPPCPPIYADHLSVELNGFRKDPEASNNDTFPVVNEAPVEEWEKINSIIK